MRETRLDSNTLLRRFCERVTRDGIDCIGLRYICHIIKITTFEKFVSYTLRLRGHSKQNLLRLEILLRHKLQAKLQAVACLAVIKSRNIFVASLY